MSFRGFLPLLGAVGLALTTAPAHGAEVADYHHVHLTATNAQEAADWYMEHMGCEDFGRAGACQVGDVQIIFFERDVQGGSVGSGVDHIGFSFRDLGTRMTGWKAAGLNVLEDVREIEGLFKLAFIEDPWGTKIEVVEDLEDLGFHHIHLRSQNPEETLAWYHNIFGGETDRMKGRINGVRYGRVWLLASRHTKGSLEPTQGRAIDHLGWGFADLDAAAVEIRSKGIEFQMDPRPYTNPLGQDMKISFVVGPDDVRIEVVQPGD